MSEYINLEDNQGRVRCIKACNPIYDDGWVYFDGLDDNGVMQQYRVKLNPPKENDK